MGGGNVFTGVCLFTGGRGCGIEGDVCPGVSGGHPPQVRRHPPPPPPPRWPLLRIGTHPTGMHSCDCWSFSKGCRYYFKNKGNLHITIEVFKCLKMLPVCMTYSLYKGNWKWPASISNIDLIPGNFSLNPVAFVAKLHQAPTHKTPCGCKTSR